MNTYERQCPVCGNTITHKNEVSCKRSIDHQLPCRSCSARQNLEKGIGRREKLTVEQETELCSLYQSGTKTRDLAKQYGIKQLTVQRYLHRNQIEFRNHSSEIRKYKTPQESYEAQLQNMRAWAQANREERKEQRRKSGAYKLPARLAKYGITFEEWSLLLEQQNFQCPICGKSLDLSERYPDTDHCHTTGKVRGILHNKCNRLLACAEDNIQTLQRAIEYLQR